MFQTSCRKTVKNCIFPPPLSISYSLLLHSSVNNLGMKKKLHFIYIVGMGREKMVSDADVSRKKKGLQLVSMFCTLTRSTHFVPKTILSNSSSPPNSNLFMLQTHPRPRINPSFKSASWCYGGKETGDSWDLSKI